ncbi:hypothetical protein MHBO_002305 [Bonamia ostreae]|uniref:F-box domain-containing protein n=1 Tax=Bonamia ostreae TaxID=126728 RepID=A0ABV2AMH4_9EUKA
MRNFIYTLGIAGVVVSYAAYRLSRSINNGEDEAERKKRREQEQIKKESAMSKTKNFNAILMCCQLNSFIINEGLSIEDYTGKTSLGRLENFLPKEVFQSIFGYCDISDLCRIKEVSKSWKSFLDHFLKSKDFLRKCAMRGFKKEHRKNYWLIISNFKERGTFEVFLSKKDTIF